MRLPNEQRILSEALRGLRPPTDSLAEAASPVPAKGDYGYTGEDDNGFFVVYYNEETGAKFASPDEAEEHGEEMGDYPLEVIRFVDSGKDANYEVVKVLRGEPEEPEDDDMEERWWHDEPSAQREKEKMKRRKGLLYDE
jgi:hypothetical protein